MSSTPPRSVFSSQSQFATPREPMTTRRASPALTSVASGAPGMLFKFVSDDKGFGHFSYASEGALKVLGLSPRALCTQPQRFIELVMEDERPGLFDTMSESVTTLPREGGPQKVKNLILS